MNATQISNNLQYLLLRFEKQQSRQRRYFEKFKHLNKSMKRTSQLINYHAKLLSGQNDENLKIDMNDTPKSSKSPVRQLAKRSVPFNTINDSSRTSKQKQRRIVVESSDDEQMEDQQDVFMYNIQNQPSTSKLITNTGTVKKTAPKMNAVKKVYTELDFGTNDTMDIFTVRKQQGSIMFNKKPRSILYNIAGDSLGQAMSELMITTSLDGELHFWNSSSRQKIKTIGQNHIFDSWIEDICWATPSTLVCTPSKSNEPIKLVHLCNVTNSNVEGRIQTLNDTPHEGGISVVASVETSGVYNTKNMEKSSFVTGGYDKSVYMWNLKRGSAHENFQVDSVYRLGISQHTSSIQSLFYDKYHNLLFSGGADERFLTFDLQTSYTTRLIRLDHRVNHISQSPVNPNILLLTMATKREQFLIYDRRCPEPTCFKLKFGQTENENLSRYIKPEMHFNGYTVCCGTQAASRLNFWDIRYVGVSRNLSFSMDTPAKTRNLRALFINNTNTVVTLSNDRMLNWLDYAVKKDEVVKTLV
ncbi:WD40-repeat-containing domain protein [Cokeromyces recurvatus]|uniref:WD40-repeat-containing domain protein n=1 Tax=Cokeromyces recurvatus TaxID=90255 RepID=UPI0022201EB6|nr:WD40-repeat-containing domain protein [Cokeromyces recurvatus]KAI7901138.1 WD40-repeat-containing domain protein [Cokeromyces recurvatus]